jgi:hypothetical protein
MNLDHLPVNAQRWLVRNREQFGTTDGLPGEFHREALYQTIALGRSVVIVTTQHRLRKGKVVMSGRAGWVLNMGGQYGTPGIATPENTVWVSGTRNLKGVTLIV